jgi:transcriptional regulator with XRE-family HTH domain
MEFGTKVRKLRKKKGISLRKFAGRVGMSPTYLSKVERNEFKPPGEKKIIAIAEALDIDSDELLALGGRVASDVLEIIKKDPAFITDIIRQYK